MSSRSFCVLYVGFWLFMISIVMFFLIADPMAKVREEENNWMIEHSCSEITAHQPSFLTDNGETVPIRWTKVSEYHVLHDVPLIEGGQYTDNDKNIWEILQYRASDRALVCKNVDHSTP